MRREQIDSIVCALTSEEVEELGLVQEAESCRENGISFVSFPIEDRSVPVSNAEFEALLSWIQREISGGKAIAVHCRAGIGRSSLIAASVLVRNGLSAVEAFRAVEEARGTLVPDTAEQRAWVEAFAARHSNGNQDVE